MNGMNYVVIAGNIGGKILSGTTDDGRPACSFSVASEAGKRVTWVRINAYDKLAEYCHGKMSKGGYCLVVGELMNRRGQYDKLTEVRARHISFVESAIVDSDNSQENSGE